MSRTAAAVPDLAALHEALIEAQTSVIALALADAQQSHWDPVFDLGNARAYRDAAAELSDGLINSAGRDVCPSRSAWEPLPRNRERNLP